ncbi:MAG: aspartyl/glutamyl-tRNA amidotransferase subunit C [Oscillospiraceae bacterium]|jgi:aspartyl/glutamyl-tRNA(Asn/Gln) amidotransferase C subunit|nr:aspartyl/glutamyl-tRNA amidotransferase subunit C [Oscillospiraceae bacterium]
MKENNLERLAELAKIEFLPEELARMENDMTSIIELMDSLRDVELNEAFGEDEVLRLAMLREDASLKSMETVLLVSQSPEGADFSIPKILE